MTGMRRVERAAQQPDAAAPPADRCPTAQGRTCPVPRTRYLYVVSCSAPTGPRGGSRWVEMPISAPMPNSPPSANWVERSEEHTSELQSLTNLVCRLLLEKKT